MGAIRWIVSAVICAACAMLFLHFGPALARIMFPEQTAMTGQWWLFGYMGIGFSLGCLAFVAGTIGSFWVGPDGWVLILGGLLATMVLPLLWLPATVGILAYWSVTGRMPQV